MRVSGVITVLWSICGPTLFRLVIGRFDVRSFVHQRLSSWYHNLIPSFRCMANRRDVPTSFEEQTSLQKPFTHIPVVARSNKVAGRAVHDVEVRCNGGAEATASETASDTSRRVARSQAQCRFLVRFCCRFLSVVVSQANTAFIPLVHLSDIDPPNFAEGNMALVSTSVIRLLSCCCCGVDVHLRVPPYTVCVLLCACMCLRVSTAT